MTNFEFYKDEILELATRGCGIAVNSEGRPVSCSECSCCEECLFRDDEKCNTSLCVWFYEEYSPMITREEKQFLELCKTGYVVRDSNGTLCFYREKPVKEKNIWSFTSCYCSIYRLINIKFDFISWEDEEPWRVEDLLKLRVEEEK